MMASYAYPPKEGLYDPAWERDACGVGFCANIDGTQSHAMIEKGLEILCNLAHRGAVGADKDTGDGAGILIQVSRTFFEKACPESGFSLPEGLFGAGFLFMPTDETLRSKCVEWVERSAEASGCRVVGWRGVPTKIDAIGPGARSTCPVMQQVFFAPASEMKPDAFERQLYRLRRLVEKAIKATSHPQASMFHIASLSSRTICYKGMMLAHQLAEFFPDLLDPSMESATCVAHQRYSTNTFPTWDLAQPFRVLSHNGEINTLCGNVNHVATSESRMISDVYGRELPDLLPVIHNPSSSDSACFDNMLEFLMMNGRSLPHCLMMLAPEAWGKKCHMGHDRRAFYEYHSMLMEPWDGPAALVTSDGTSICAALDRNGLRPLRYEITSDGLIVGASEIGVLDLPEQSVIEKGRLGPGMLLLVDTARGRVLHDAEVKAEVCRRKPYRRWLKANRIELRGLFGHQGGVSFDNETLLERQRIFGYSREDINDIITPMYVNGVEPIGSMGDDTPLAVLSDQPQLLFNYFKQLFAQVTNPAIDPIREKLVMSLTTYLGPMGNVLGETPQHARMLKLDSPILASDDLKRIRTMGQEEFPSVTLSMTFPVREGAEGMARALDQLASDAAAAVSAGKEVVILSDRDVSVEVAPIPSLLATAAVDGHLCQAGLRKQANIVIESGEPREVQHFALLFGYGATAVNPYLALETVADRRENGQVECEHSLQDAVENYIAAIDKGLLKIFSKMGISTLRSYRDAQIFEALGLSEEFVHQYFTHTTSRIGGLNQAGVATETLARHAQAYPTQSGGSALLDSGGRYSLRRDGERHLWTPETIHLLHRAVREDSAEHYAAFSETINNQEHRLTTLRSMIDFVPGKSVSIDEVEPAEGIMKRFITGAMSFGSISPEAHETLAIAMNRIGSRSNSGEGGEDRKRYTPDADGASRCSMTKQIASGRFGVTAEYCNQCKELQIKVSQGAKPGEGGHLPGHKVNQQIAEMRHSTPGISLISPPPHHDIYSIEDLAQLIYDLKNVNPAADINVKLVSKAGIGTIAAGVSKGHADAILISGGDGGTGAAPLSSIKYAGIPNELGLSETQQTLVKNDLRGRVRLQTDGQLRTGRDVAIAALLGAEEYGFATAALVTVGCIMMRKCQKNNCPVGVATQDPELRKRYCGQPEHVIRYFRFIADELRTIMAELGYRTVDDMVGCADRLKLRDGIDHPKAATLDLSKIFCLPEEARHFARRKVMDQNHDLESAMDQTLLQDAAPALDNGQPVDLTYSVRNVHRTVGTMLAGEVARRYGQDGLPDNTIQLSFVGSAGQSFGAFTTRGMTMQLTGDANDYLGKSLSGGRLIVQTPADCAMQPEVNTLIGNVAFYGATSGQAYINGLAGERFAIRNSGATLVVEGVGNHGCEYMTGGTVVVLGECGVNFAAGMSGGVAYVYDPAQDFDLKCNLEMVDLDPLMTCDVDETETVRALIAEHVAQTNSRLGSDLLTDWAKTQQLMVRVMPIEYRRYLARQGKEQTDASRRTGAEVVRQQ